MPNARSLHANFSFALFIILACLAIACSSTIEYNPDAVIRIEESGSGYSLIKGDEPFKIRGVAGHQNLPLLKKIGGNTIRTYDTLGLMTILDEAHRNNLMVIAGLVLPKSRENWFYENDSLVSAYNTGLRKIIQRFKDHPALLMWCLGNEPNFYDFLNFRFSAAYNLFLETLRNADSGHPVAMAVANFSDREIFNLKVKINSIDVLMINTFGRLPELEKDMAIYKWLWRGPFIIGEYGISGPWETNTTAWQVPLEPDDRTKANRLKEMFHELPLQNPRCLGALAFYWGQRQEATHTWFNFFSGSGEINESVFALSELWGEPLGGNRPPQVTQLQIDAHDEHNQLLFRENSIHSGVVSITDPDADSLAVEWTIRPDDWFFEKGRTPDAVAGSILSSAKEGRQVTFQAPGKPGPFRLFVKVYDGKGHFATTNLPFYVVQ